jgi:phosphate acetyltransferase
LRAALWAIGPARDVHIVSSSFYMDFPAPGFSFRVGECNRLIGEGGGVGERVLTFADAGVVPDPTADQLAEIALSAAHDRSRIVGDAPIVAFLSYSTKGSGSGPKVEKVRQAVARFREIAPDIPSDGELQGDAALVPSVSRSKAPDSFVEGCANIFIFPDLDSGNVAYKLVQRLAGATATGPIVQGLARPMIDLSRGATTDDIVDGAAVGILQSVDSDAS